jgi:hypothetical protein
MELSLTIEPRQEQILGLSLVGGTSASIFPEVEKAISSSKSAQRALVAVRKGPELDLFASFMDYLLCSIIPEITSFCFAYYAGKGLPLRDQITAEGRDSLETLLLGALEAALLFWNNNAEVDWDQMGSLLKTLGIPKIKLYAMGPGALDELAEAAA